jgi:trehalose 6-phosphate phosphatase
MMPPVPARPALFLDVDGTLLPIAERPDDVRSDMALRGQLERLQVVLGGALAILTGRTLVKLDELFAPLVLPAAGMHGLERRRSDFSIVKAPLDPALLDAARSVLGALAQRHPRLFLEDKGVALAVHYRGAQDLAGPLQDVLAKLCEQLNHRYHIQEGLDVFELKPLDYNKGTALADFMLEGVFRDRQPVVIGDDLTDLDAFRAAERLNGLTIGIGQRIRGHWQLTDPQALHRWLEELTRTMAVSDRF